MKFSKLLILPLLLIGGSLTSCKTEKTIVVAEVTHSLFYAPQYLADKLGYFKEAGFNVDFLATPGADKTMAALLAKDADIALMGPEATIYVYARKKTNYAINFADLTAKDGSFLLGRDEDKDFNFQKLKGKTIIGGRKGGMPEMTLEYVLKKAGLDVKQNDETAEVNIRTDVQFDVLAGAFTSGQSDYVALFEPAASAVVKNKVGHIVASIGESSGEIPYTCYSTLEETLVENKEDLKKFTLAISKAMDYMKSHKPSELAPLLRPYFVSSTEDEIAAILSNYIKIGAWKDDLKLSTEGFEKLIEILSLANEFPDVSKVGLYDKLVKNILD